MPENSVDHYLHILRSEIDWRKRVEAIHALRGINTDEAFQAIVSALDNENANVVSHAVEVLGQFGTRATPALIDALSKPKKMPLWNIILALRNIQDKRTIPALKKLVEIRDNRTALKALEVLLELMDEEDARHYVSDGLQDKRRAFQRKYARKAAHLGMVEAIPILVEALTEPAGAHSYLKRKYPALALAELGEPALEYLLDASHHEDEGTRQAAAEGLARIPGARATARLVEMMDDPNSSVRGISINSIGSREDIDPIPLLACRLDPEKPSASVLGALGHTGQLEAVPLILRTLPKAESETTIVLYSLSRRYWDRHMRGKDTSHMEELAQALQSDDNRLVITAIWELASLTNPCLKIREAYLKDHDSLEGLDIPAICVQIRKLLVPMLSHSDPHVRWAAVYAVGHVGDKALVPVISHLLMEDTYYVAREALGLLAKLRGYGIDTSAAIPGLMAAIRRSEPLIVRRAILALGFTGDSTAIDVLMELTKHPDGEMRSLAANALSVFQQEEVFLRLFDLLQNDPAMGVRESALRALRDLQDPRIFEYLVEVVNDVGPDAKATYELRKWGIFHLAHLDDERAVPVLRYAVDHTPDWQIKKYAVESLGKRR
jgi:HEAT repeat protein